MNQEQWASIAKSLNTVWREKCKCPQFINNYGRTMGFMLAVNGLLDGVEGADKEWLEQMRAQIYDLGS